MFSTTLGSGFCCDVHRTQLAATTRDTMHGVPPGGCPLDAAAHRRPAWKSHSFPPSQEGAAGTCLQGKHLHSLTFRDLPWDGGEGSEEGETCSKPRTAVPRPDVYGHFESHR